MKKIFFGLLRSLGLEKTFTKLLLGLHNLLYVMISRMAIITNNGVHPKHRILSYELWFKNQIRAGDIVVDVGSNTGGLPVVLSDKAKQVHGIEIDQGHHKKALKHLLPNVNWINADATRYDYRQIGPVDVMTLSNVLEHIDRRVEFLKAVISQAVWKDPQNKRILIRVPMLDRDWLAVYKKEMGVEWRLDKTHYTEYTFEDFQSEMHQAGLKILQHEVRFGELYAVCTNQ